MTPIPPMERHGQLEVDVFCTQCFYNLHGQIVTIDPHLNIPVCRCPECGRFHPAGTGVTSSNVWMRRLASILLFAWVGMINAGAFGIALAFFGLSVTSVEAFSYYDATPIALNKWKTVERLHPWQDAGTYDPNINGINTMLWISAGSLVLGFIAGTLCVTLLWHWQRPRYLWVMALPLLPLLAQIMIYHSVPDYESIQMDCILHALSQTGIQSIGILIGVLTGRKVSRTIVKMIIPPKPRQTLAFLWIVDGLKPPTV